MMGSIHVLLKLSGAGLVDVTEGTPELPYKFFVHERAGGTGFFTACNHSYLLVSGMIAL